MTIFRDVILILTNGMIARYNVRGSARDLGSKLIYIFFNNPSSSVGHALANALVFGMLELATMSSLALAYL